MSVANAIRNPRTYLSGVLNTYRTVLFDPETFFDELESRGFRNEVLLVLVVGIIGYVGPYLAADHLLSAFRVGPSVNMDKPPIRTEVALQVQGRAIQFLLLTIAVWIVGGFLLYLVSWLYSERSDLRHTLKNTAWGLVPLVATNAIQSIAFFMAYQDVVVQSNNPNIWFRSEVQGSASQVTDAIWSQVTDDPLILGSAVVGGAFIVWCWYIWAYAIIDVRRLDRRTGFLVATAPVLVYVAGRAAMFLGLV